MYAQYFGLNDNPFTITPNPRYLYLGTRHAEALAHLLYGVTESDGFIQLTGEVGTGKTTLIRSLLEQMPEHVDAALIFNPQMALTEFLEAICRELGVPLGANHSAAQITRILNSYLLEAHARGRRVVLIIDEAQNLPRNLLEQIRLLTNLETHNHKLMQIILVGQPELREVLARRDLRQLAQRITARYHLTPLNAADTRAYVGHRLRIAGARGAIFTAGALRRVYRDSGGIPRLINIIADRALLGAYAAGQRQCSARLARRACREALSPRRERRWALRAATAALATAAIIMGSLAGWSWQSQSSTSPATGDDRVATTSAQSRARTTITAWIQQHGATAGTDNAFEALFSLWDEHYAGDAGAAACKQARRAGLSCLYRNAAWQELMAYNRPAIVDLKLTNGRQYQVVVSEIEQGSVTLRAGAASHVFPASAVRHLWNRQFLLLWQPPPTRDELIRPGMTGPAVAWLGQKLDEIDPNQPGAERTIDDYDAALAGAVRHFQKKHDLNVDGIAGVHTLIKLNGVLNNARIPRLTTKAS